MAKSSGLGDNYYVAQYDLSGDIGSLGSISGGNEPLDVTAINASAHERVGGIRDGTIEFTTFINTAVGQEHAALSPLPTTDVIVSYFRGATLGDAAASMVAKQANYDIERGDDGSITASVEALANAYGLQWGVQLTAGKRTDTAATDGTSVDLGTGSLAFGLVAFLHVFSFSGTSVTVKIQESSDNGAGDAWADVTGGGFTAATGATSQRIATSLTQTVERYIRCVTTGTFSSAVFSVNAVRNDTLTAF